MFRLLNIDHLVLRVVDLAKMMHFYCDALGCAVERRQDNIGLVQLRAGSALIDLVPVDGELGRAGGSAPGKEGRNLDHFCLRIEPFDEVAIQRQLSRHGYEAGKVERRYGAEGEGPSIYVTDPEGNVVEFKGPPDHQSIRQADGVARPKADGQPFAREGPPPAGHLGREALAVYHPPRGQGAPPAPAPQLKR